MEKAQLSCVDCHVVHCDKGRGEYPDFCMTTHLNPEVLEKALEEYQQEENHRAMLAASETEYEGYCRLTRVQEIMEFARKIGAKKIGIATCVGLIREARILSKIFRSHGFEVVGAACKIGAVPKHTLGIPMEHENLGKHSCNPILQAMVLKEAGTDLNVVVGLCVGHDSLFYKYSHTLTTTAVTKDRVLGHNPAAALYTAESYYQKKLFPDEK